MVTADLGVVAAFSGDTAKPAQYYSAKQWESLSETDKKAFRSHKIIVEEGQLLTFTDLEAARYGFSQGSFLDLDSFLQAKGWKVLATMATTWSEDMVRAIGKFAPLLMLLGFGALYMEFKTPGFSVFGMLGIALLAVAFGSKYAVGLADHTELLVLIAGFVLFLVEIYVFPGTFIAGTAGLVLMLVALTLSLQGFTLPDPDMPWELKDMVNNLALTLGMAALAVFVPFLGARYVLPNLPKKAQVVADATLKDAHSAASDAPASLVVGAAGETKTALRPTGKAAFAGLTLEVVTRGEFIEAGRAVEVREIHGQKVVVRARETSA
jgi:membrane-bound serine protease (ClpP class)